MGLQTRRASAGFSLLAETAGRFSRPPVIHTQVAAQYGKDSHELASTGLKKTSEYKKRGPKPASAPHTPPAS
jgi:hypothetical protein